MATRTGYEVNSMKVVFDRISPFGVEASVKSSWCFPAMDVRIEVIDQTLHKRRKEGM